MRLLPIIHSAYCTNPKCQACVWYSVMEPENPERQFMAMTVPEALRCVHCRTVFAAPGAALDDEDMSHLEVTNTFKTPNGAAGWRDSQ